MPAERFPLLPGVGHGGEAGLLLGVDGGGTRTDCLLATLDGVVIGRGSSGPSNLQAVGIDAAVCEIEKAVRLAMREAACSGGTARITSACFGLAGAGRKRDRDMVEMRLRRLLAEVCSPDAPFPALTVVNDGIIALAGANAGEPGVVVIAGTGSLAYGVSPDGREARAGGWGYILGDEGSAYDIGVKGLREALRAADGRQIPTCLTEDLAVALEIEEIEDVVSVVYSGMTRPEIAALAPVVAKAAEKGDHVAQDIVVDAGRELGLMALAVIDRLGMSGGAGNVAAVGGVLESNEMALDAMRGRVKVSVPAWSVERGKFSPAVGALLVAGRAIGGGSIDEDHAPDNVCS